MENRNWATTALILTLESFSPQHKIAKVLVNSPTHTYILDAIMFGGAKNKIASFFMPHYTGTLWLYTNPIKDAHKVVDFDVTKERSGIRESLARIWAASFATELCIKLKTSIEWKLINAFLDGINISDDNECDTAVLRFIWRLSVSSGFATPILECSYCKKKGWEKGMYFDHSIGEFFCSECCQNKNSSSYLCKEALEYLYKIAYKSPKDARCTKLSSKVSSSLRVFLFRFAEDMCSSNLYSLSSKNPIYIATQL